MAGGTPSLLGPKAIETILKWIQPPSDIEITLEANPENVSKALFEDYRSIGVNRVSLGVQSLDSQLLQILDRRHAAEIALQAISDLSKAGLENISIDLMYDIPDQTLESWKNTLRIVQSLPITHFSLYNLTIEPHTVFFKYRKTLQERVPKAEESLKMYLEARNLGFEQYEISAFSRKAKRSQHNSGYWTGRPFWGLGPSAFSFWEGKRFRNVANLNRYYKALELGESPIDFEESLSKEDLEKELLVIGLRLCEGVDLSKFSVDRVKIDKLIEEGLLQQDRQRLRLTQKGMLFYDSVAVELI